MAKGTTIRTLAPQPPRGGRGLTLVINGLASHFKGRAVMTRDLAAQATAYDLQTVEGGGVTPREAYEGRYYDTDMGLGLTETADDIVLTSAVCSVSRKKTIVETAIAGRNGTVKEAVSAQDYEIDVTLTLISTADEYPEEGMRRLASLADERSAVYVDSAFLRLFDIDRAVITELKVEQETYGNTQEVTLKLVSDEDYEVEVTAS